MSLNTANEELCAFLCYGKHNSTGSDKKVAVVVLGPGSAALPAKRPPVDAERNESNRKLPLLNRQSDDGFRYRPQMAELKGMTDQGICLF